MVQAHRMLGVAYLYANRAADARREFHKLLELRPDYRFDPLMDPQPVVDAFNAVVKEEEAEIAAIETRRRLRDQELAARRQREARLHAAPATTVVYERHSYVLNFVPFGAGQFQNGQRRKGWLFLGIEGGLAAISLGAFLTNFALYGDPAAASLPDPTNGRRHRAAGPLPARSNRSFTGEHLPGPAARPVGLGRPVFCCGDLGRDRRPPTLPA